MDRAYEGRKEGGRPLGNTTPREHMEKGLERLKEMQDAVLFQRRREERIDN